MKNITKYDFYKTKYGDELLIDVVMLKDIKKYLSDAPLHFLTYYDVTIITEGEGLFKIDNAVHTVKATDVLFTLPHQFREWDAKNIIDGYALIFEGEFLLSFFNDQHFLEHISCFNLNRTTNILSLSEYEFQQIKSLIQEIQFEIKEYSQKDKHVLRALLYQILMQLDRLFIKQNGVTKNADRNRHVEKFLSLVNANCQKFHSVQHYANELCITPNYLNELVKKEMKNTAKQFIQSRLISESKKLLLYSHLSITEISEHFSFENPSYFIRFFHKNTGFTPFQFRKIEKP